MFIHRHPTLCVGFLGQQLQTHPINIRAIRLPAIASAQARLAGVFRAAETRAKKYHLCDPCVSVVKPYKEF
jgi:hypothetical protein